MTDQIISVQENNVWKLNRPIDVTFNQDVDFSTVTLNTIHISDITLPAGVESVALSHGEDHDLAIASVIAPKGGSDDEEVEAADAGEEAAEEGDSEE